MFANHRHWWISLFKLIVFICDWLFLLMQFFIPNHLWWKCNSARVYSAAYFSYGQKVHVKWKCIPPLWKNMWQLKNQEPCQQAQVHFLYEYIYGREGTVRNQDYISVEFSKYYYLQHKWSTILTSMVWSGLEKAWYAIENISKEIDTRHRLQKQTARESPFSMEGGQSQRLNAIILSNSFESQITGGEVEHW